MDALKLLTKSFKGESADFKLSVPNDSFFPYACHYNPYTILTRSGQLLQTIKIVGYNFETVGNQVIDLRETVRKAILGNIISPQFSLYFHTIRTRRSIDPGGTYDNYFARDLHNAWGQKNYWHDKYVNELYITIVHDAPPLGSFGLQGMLSPFFPGMIRKRFEHQLEQAHQYLNQVTNGVLTVLEEYGAHKLTIKETADEIYSEPLQFLSNLIYLKETPVPLPIVDLATFMRRYKIAFGNNTVEVHYRNHKQFAAILTIKEYHDLPSHLLDEFLQLPIQFVVTQTVDFVKAKQVMEEYKYQDYILRVSGDERLRTISGLEGIMNYDAKAPTSFGQHQISIMVVEDTLSKLNQSVKRCVQSISGLGFIPIREDLWMEDCFWSQLPGNNDFICRKGNINTKAVAGYASLYNYPAGKLHNPWGKALTLLRTSRGTPYFFNFQVEEKQRNTLIIGPSKAGKTVMLHFLLAESLKYKPHLWIFNQDPHTLSFIRALGGLSLSIQPHGTQGLCNPFTLPLDENYAGFLEQWLYAVLWPSTPLTTQHQTLCQNAIRYCYQPEHTHRSLTLIDQFLRTQSTPEATQAIEHLTKWLQGGVLHAVFNETTDHFTHGSHIKQFSFAPDLSPALLRPIMLMCQYRILKLLTEEPTIIAMDNAASLLHGVLSMQELAIWEKILEKHNALWVMTLRSPVDEASKQTVEMLCSFAATRLVLPALHTAKECGKLLNLTPTEVALISDLKAISRQFLLKTPQESILLELSLSGLEPWLSILSNNQADYATLEIAIQDKGTLPHEWLPRFYELFKAA